VEQKTTAEAASEANKAKQMERAGAAMQIQQALYDNALATESFGHYVNAVLFMIAAVMAQSKEAEVTKMMSYISTKTQEIKAAEAANLKIQQETQR
jgi:hypothetical protein